MGGQTTGTEFSCGADKCPSGESRSLLNPMIAADSCETARLGARECCARLPGRAATPNRLSRGSQNGKAGELEDVGNAY